MNGEVSIFGVYFPTLLLIALAALIISGLVSRALGPSGFYRFVAYRALFDLALFVLTMGGLLWLAIKTGFHP